MNDVSAETRAAIRREYVYGDPRHSTCVAGIAAKFNLDAETVERIVNGSGRDEEPAAVSTVGSKAMTRMQQRKALLLILEGRM
jgi:hypothetical protein